MFLAFVAVVVALKDSIEVLVAVASRMNTMGLSLEISNIMVVGLLVHEIEVASKKATSSLLCWARAEVRSNSC